MNQIEIQIVHAKIAKRTQQRRFDMLGSMKRVPQFTGNPKVLAIADPLS